MLLFNQRVYKISRSFTAKDFHFIQNFNNFFVCYSVRIAWPKAFHFFSILFCFASQVEQKESSILIVNFVSMLLSTKFSVQGTDDGMLQRI